jgi:hypothetical protein
MLESTAPSGLRAAGVGFAMLREAGNACGGGISESTSMKEHLSVFFKKAPGRTRREKLKTTVNALLWAEN